MHFQQHFSEKGKSPRGRSSPFLQIFNPFELFLSQNPENDGDLPTLPSANNKSTVGDSAPLPVPFWPNPVVLYPSTQERDNVNQSYQSYQPHYGTSNLTNKTYTMISFLLQGVPVPFAQVICQCLEGSINGSNKTIVVICWRDHRLDAGVLRDGNNISLVSTILPLASLSVVSHAFDRNLGSHTISSHCLTFPNCFT